MQTKLPLDIYTQNIQVLLRFPFIIMYLSFINFSFQYQAKENIRTWSPAVNDRMKNPSHVQPSEKIGVLLSFFWDNLALTFLVKENTSIWLFLYDKSNSYSVNMSAHLYKPYISNKSIEFSSKSMFKLTFKQKSKYSLAKKRPVVQTKSL